MKIILAGIEYVGTTTIANLLKDEKAKRSLNYEYLEKL